MNLLVAIVIHVLFLLSIFYIHFRSPILQGLPDGDEHNAPPADRLVLFVSDGLRLESFLKDDLERTPFLRKKLLKEGVFGVSNTRVPTESRPGHVALLGGVYEDPSAVFKGWKENPVEFDSVLNRSSVSYCWGSPDIVNMFSQGAIKGRVHTATYHSGREIFSQTANTSLLDIWVFDRVQQFLVSDEARKEVLGRKKVILFLHLLGMDTAGHVYKPHSKLFARNLMIVDRGIEAIVQLVERATGNDGRTAFIFTSDHGMTDQGSHGSGDPLETETPFLAWGAGFSHWKTTHSLQHEQRDVLELDGNQIPMHQIQQADAAPLMSAVLGISVPKNSIGKLPRSMLNVSEEYGAWAMRNNADQLLQQYYRWQKETEGKMLQWLTLPKQNSLKHEINHLMVKKETATTRKDYVEVQNLTDTLMDVTIEAIRYFQSYYKPHLFLSLTLTMMGWLLILAKETFVVSTNDSSAVERTKTRTITCVALSFASIVLVFNIAQNTPLPIIIYFLVPIALWGYIGAQWRDFKTLFHWNAFVNYFKFVFAVEALVLGFLYRMALVPLLLFHCVLLVKSFYPQNHMEWRWITVNVFLAAFLLIPVGNTFFANVYFLYASIAIWTVANITVLMKSSSLLLFKLFTLLMHLLQSANFLFILYCIDKSHAVPQFSRTMCWVFSAFGVLSPFFSTSSVTERMLAIFSGLSGPYMMLSLSYEPLFLFCFCCTLYNWFYVEQSEAQRSKQRDSSTASDSKPCGVEDVRRILAFMIFLLTSFYGTGNLASISSFDPNSVRCFVSTFSPFTMMGLIVFKLLIPALMLACALKAINGLHSTPKGRTFTLILIVCDGMCMNFFFLVRNEGSWLEIGTSISHFVILECTTIVVVGLYELARFYLKWTFGRGKLCSYRSKQPSQVA
ncbi:GPI ethanolamine phosphate transferase 1-like [Anopheles ziemanni]|uniref:GPI ethanolamine phosphate transferase 1-like n=1 Tax=Anopheles coustani TaxID=139045 RepID=UPI002659EB8E|nr:GPI ethanolamine phosphate transferase 1-like [Anopheles coustani]XP_058174689.1 GPI ethanolamine phosphate transferase 1-like [Anopheles ziemanni]